MRVKLWVKLTGAFVLVAIVAVGLIAVLANRAASLGFQRYLQAGEVTQLELLQAQLAAYYAQTGSWTGANSLLRDSGLGGQGYFLRLLDAEGAGVASRGGQGRFFEPEVSLPIRVDGRLVGTLMMARPGLGTHAGDQYLETVNRAIVWAGLAAAALALLLGALLAQGLTRPLRQMTQATRAVAAGDLAQQVRVDSRDELGELARDFNQMARALQTAEAQRQQLLADTAHDLRTPISVIRSHLEAMLDGVFPATPDNLALVHEETLRLGRLVEDVRTLSLMESGQASLELAALDVTALARRAVAAFAPLAEADGVTLTLEAEPTPPVQADGARIHQVLANLLANALRYAPQGEQSAPTVRVLVQQAGGAVRVSVSDNGPGLTAAQQAQVFERFWRGDAARSRGQGAPGWGWPLRAALCRRTGALLA
jgi:signal transduction histidine kinase